jgi:hypothetical protein
VEIKTTIAIVALVLAVVAISGCTDNIISSLNASDLSPNSSSANTNSPNTIGSPSTDTTNIGSTIDSNAHVVPWFSGGPMGELNLANFAGAGTKAPYNCTLVNGTLPAGFALEGCKIIGKVADLPPGTTEIVQPSFWVMINDSSRPAITSAVEISLRFTQNDMTMSLKPGTCTVNEQCSVELVDDITGGQVPYGFELDSLANGAPPLGMTLDTQNGMLSGTPTRAGIYSFSICVVDMTGVYRCKQASVTVGEQASTPTVNDGGGTPTATETPSVTFDSIECTLESKSDIPGVGIHVGEIVGHEYVFKLTGSGTVTGPVGTRMWVASQTSDAGDFGGSYFSDSTASFTTDSWTNTRESSGYSPIQYKYDRGSGDPETTTWHFDGGDYTVQESEFSGPFNGDSVSFSIFASYYADISGSILGGYYTSSKVTCSG